MQRVVLSATVWPLKRYTDYSLVHNSPEDFSPGTYHRTTIHQADYLPAVLFSVRNFTGGLFTITSYLAQRSSEASRRSIRHAELVYLRFVAYLSHDYDWLFMVALCNRATINIFMLFMVALCNRADHYILPCDFYLSFFLPSFFSSPNLSGRILDVYHTSTHGVALVRI